MYWILSCPEGLKSSQVKSSQVKSSQVKSSQVKNVDFCCAFASSLSTFFFRSPRLIFFITPPAIFKVIRVCLLVFVWKLQDTGKFHVTLFESARFTCCGRARLKVPSRSEAVLKRAETLPAHSESHFTTCRFAECEVCTRFDLTCREGVSVSQVHRQAGLATLRQMSGDLDSTLSARRGAVF